MLEKMADFSTRVRNGKWKGYTWKPIRNVISVGIGGSDLGPAMTYEALRYYSQRNLTFRFISNIDGTDVRTGSPLPLGTQERGGEVDFALFSRHASHVRLGLFDPPEDAVPAQAIDLDTKRNRTGDSVVFCAPKASYSSSGGSGRQKLELREMVRPFTVPASR